jgi:hypothetical protein
MGPRPGDARRVLVSGGAIVLHVGWTCESQLPFRRVDGERVAVPDAILQMDRAARRSVSPDQPGSLMLDR